MFENLGHFFKRMVKTEQQKELGSKDAAKERLHLVLMQDRANVSADFLELMKQEIIDVIKKYIVVDEETIDVRLTNQTNDDGTNGAPSLYANIPIVNIKNDMMAEKIKDFEGVDFNKEMGIPTYTENVSKKEEKELETPPVIELPENNSVPNSNVSEEPKMEEPKEETEEEEVKELFEEVDEAYDEDDDDVTFDDLLKAAEAADAAEAAENSNIENSENLEDKTNSSKSKNKSNSKTKDKRKKKN